jgi:sulfite reductase alpha subunit-like flavoprotein
MIGPGTGLAPFMSFIHQRVAAGSAFGKQVLFFGCRKRTQDYLYGFEQLAEHLFL